MLFIIPGIIALIGLILSFAPSENVSEGGFMLLILAFMVAMFLLPLYTP